MTTLPTGNPFSIVSNPRLRSPCKISIAKDENEGESGGWKFVDKVESKREDGKWVSCGINKIGDVVDVGVLDDDDDDDDEGDVVVEFDFDEKSNMGKDVMWNGMDLKVVPKFWVSGNLKRNIYIYIYVIWEIDKRDVICMMEIFQQNFIPNFIPINTLPSPPKFTPATIMTFYGYL